MDVYIVDTGFFSACAYCKLNQQKNYALKY